MLALCFLGNANTDSHYRRIQHFFADFTLNFDVISRWLFALFFKPDQKSMSLLIVPTGFWEKLK
ncbi:MAG TPA: hypothetical protein VGH95_00795 [Candidatus Aquirickettsiella sp.]|jgi:hypothetical protein